MRWRYRTLRLPRSAEGGLASELIRVTLDALREREVQVLPYCPFVSAYIARHPEYVALVPLASRERFGLSGEPT